MGNQERKARTTAGQWWFYLGNYARKKERREWVNSLKWWQLTPVLIASMLVVLLLCLMLPFAWLYDKTR